MATVGTTPETITPEPRFEIGGLTFDQYKTISTALPDRPGLKVVFVDGRLSFLSPSRKHDWFAERVDDLVVAVANACEILWEDAAHATYRDEVNGVGVEGDKTYYFGTHAEIMLGSVNVDLDSQPPPDLVLEIEVSHSADDAVKVWGLLAAPEVWRLDVKRGTLVFLIHDGQEGYSPASRSAALPVLEPSDVLAQLKLADEIGSARWSLRLSDGVRTTLLPRRTG